MFAAGIVSGVLIVLVWHAFQFVTDLRATRRAAEVHFTVSLEQDKAAIGAVKACKQRLRWAKTPNPEWIRPLVDELPRLVREIAAVYYPDSPNPLLAPGLSHFTGAIQLIATDVTEFLQTRWVGRLVNVSANSALQAWVKTHQVVQKPSVKAVSKWFSRIKPWWQVVRYKSPITWVSMAFTNAAVRTLQPAIVDIVAQRALELYSGRVEIASRGNAKNKPTAL